MKLATTSCWQLTNTAQDSSLVRVGEVLLEVLGHAEALLPLLAEDGLHHFVRGEPLLVLGILERQRLELEYALGCSFLEKSP